MKKLAQGMWGWPTMLLFVGTGVLYTLGTKGLPIRCLPKALGCIRPKKNSQGISAYAALCTALAATIGTGNIVGVATALAAGGPGALFWMLLAALFGMGTQFAEGYLGAKYRIYSPNGAYGGPFAYIRYGLGEKWGWLGKLFAFLGAAVGLLGVGTVTQVNSITSAVESVFSSSARLCLMGREYSLAALISGAVVTAAAGAVLLGGVKRITKVCEALVPLMSVSYLLFSLILLLRFAEQIPSAVSLILKSAFAPEAVLGASAGISLKTAMRMGIGRGVFTNEAGLGTSAIAAAASDERDPFRQGLISMTGTFIDTIVICSVTGLCLVVTGAWSVPLEGVQITDYAWKVGLPWSATVSSFALMLCLCFFAFATIIGWNFYAESCLRYLAGERKGVKRLYRAGYLLIIAVSPLITVSTAWEMADILNVFMAFPNLVALLLLHRQVMAGRKGKGRIWTK